MFAWMKRWPRLGVVVAILLPALTVVSGRRVVQLIRADPVPSFDGVDVMNALTRADQPEGANAWEAYRDILRTDLLMDKDGFSALSGALKSVLGSGLRDGRWDVTDRTADLAMLDQFENALSRLDHAATLPGFSKPYSHEGNAIWGDLAPEKIVPAIFALLPELGSLRRLAELTTISMRANAEAGEWEVVAHRFAAGHALGQGLTKQSMLLDQLVGASIMSMSLRELAHLLDEHDLPPAAIESLLATLEAPWSAKAATHRWLDGAEVEYLDILQWTFSDDGAGGGTMLPGRVASFHNLSRYALPPPTFSERMLNPLGVLFPTRKATREAIKAHFSQAHKIVDSPFQARLDFVREQVGTRFAPVALPLLDELMPFSWRDMHSFESLESQLAGARVMLLLERLHAETGQWPSSLAESLGAEAIDPSSGEAFIYRLTPDDEHGRAYELLIPWSIFDDPKDNLIWSVINQPRAPHVSEQTGIESAAPAAPANNP